MHSVNGNRMQCSHRCARDIWRQNYIQASQGKVTIINISDTRSVRSISLDNGAKMSPKPRTLLSLVFACIRSIL